MTITPAGFFAVDVFFYIGGFLAGYLALEKLKKMKNIPLTFIPSMYIHRYLS